MAFLRYDSAQENKTPPCYHNFFFFASKQMTRKTKQIIGKPLVIGGRQLSLSTAVRAGDFVFLTGQIPFEDGEDGVPMTRGSIEDQTHAVLRRITQTLKEAGCGLDDVVKTTVWLTDRADFAGFNAVYGEYFPTDPPARSAVVTDLLVDVRVEVEVIAYHPDSPAT